MKKSHLHLGIASLGSDVEKDLRALIRKNPQWYVVVVPNLLDAELVVMDRAETLEKGQTAIWVGEIDSDSPESSLEFWSLPLRAQELAGTFRRAHAIAKLNTDMSEAIHMLEDNLSLARRLDRQLRTTRYDGIAGMHAASFYCPGERPGGDYFDLAENREKTRVLVLLSDSSSYGLASSVMASLLKISSILGVEGSSAPARLIETVWSQISQVMKPKDQWSIFLGILDRRTLEFEYCHYGTSRVYVCGPAETAVPEELTASGAAFRASAAPAKILEKKILLDPGTTLLAISDGLVELEGGERLGVALLKEDVDPQDMSLEFKFHLQKLLGKENLPPQDCTVGIVQVTRLGAKVLRLAKRGQGGSDH